MILLYSPSLIAVFLVGHKPDIPDLINYMQSGDETKITNAAGYLQHLCYVNETVKNKVRYASQFNSSLLEFYIDNPLFHDVETTMFSLLTATSLH